MEGGGQAGGPAKGTGHTLGPPQPHAGRSLAQKDQQPSAGPEQLGHASPATTANMYADITFEDMQNGLNGLNQ